MITGTRAMGCGCCGHGSFHVFAPSGGPSAFIYVECDKCKSVSTIKPTPASLTVEWGPSGDGVLCVMEPSS
jgi:hypothetical protein